jgi:hypothetical protein
MVRNFVINNGMTPTWHILIEQKILDKISDILLTQGVVILNANVHDIERALGIIMGSMSPGEFYEVVELIIHFDKPAPQTPVESEQYFETLSHHVKTMVSIAFDLLGNNLTTKDYTLQMWVDNNQPSVIKSLMNGLGPHSTRYIYACTVNDPESMRARRHRSYGDVSPPPAHWMSLSRISWREVKRFLEILVENIWYFAILPTREIMLHNATVLQLPRMPAKKVTSKLHVMEEEEVDKENQSASSMNAYHRGPIGKSGGGGFPQSARGSGGHHINPLRIDGQWPRTGSIQQPKRAYQDVTANLRTTNTSHSTPATDHTTRQPRRVKACIKRALHGVDACVRDDCIYSHEPEVLAAWRADNPDAIERSLRSSTSHAMMESIKDEIMDETMHTMQVDPYSPPPTVTYGDDDEHELWETEDEENLYDSGSPFYC